VVAAASVTTGAALQAFAGKIHTDLDGFQALRNDGQGKIVVAGASWPVGSGSASFYVARYNSGLGLDTSFDGDGMLSTTFGSGCAEPAYGVAIGNDGKIVAAGHSGSDFAVARYNVPSGLEERYFAQTDASYNITSITNANGQVAERYEYQPFGTFAALGGSWRPCRAG